MRTLSIELPDAAFDEAAREAAADGLHGADEDAPLTPEQIATIRQAQAEIARGESYTDEEVAAHFARKRADVASVR